MGLGLKNKFNGLIKEEKLGLNLKKTKVNWTQP
jgi:hypothetical protein